MSSKTPAAISDCASDILNPAHLHHDGSSLYDHLNVSCFAPTLPNECDVESAARSSILEGSHDTQARNILDVGVQDICGRDDPALDDRLPVVRAAKNIPLERLDTLPVSLTNLIPGGINRPHPQSSALVKCSSVSDNGHSIREGTTTARQSNEDLNAVTATLPWYRRALASLTMYGELSVAHVPEEFAPLRTRFQQEWSFAIGFLVALSAVNAAMFAITPDAIFKINSYTYIAVATSSTACGLGITCAAWFLLRYNWVELETFIDRSRDVYGSYVFFSLSSRIPTFCMLLSAISLMVFLGLVAYDAWPIGVLVIGVLVTLMMLLQFIVYGMHQFSASALHIWTTGRHLMGKVRQGFRSSTNDHGEYV